MEKRARFILGVDAIFYGTREAARRHWVSPSTASYWKTKLLDPDFHPNPHGGWRHGAFPPGYEPIINSLLVEFLAEHPESNRTEVRAFLSRYTDDPISLSTTSRITKRLCWSWRIPIAFQIQRYTLGNIERYRRYIEHIQQIS